MSLLFQAILGFKDNQNWSWWATQNVEALVDILGCKVSVLPFTYLVLPAFNEVILLIQKKGVGEEVQYFKGQRATWPDIIYIELLKRKLNEIE